jgi:hypothetical protein
MPQGRTSTEQTTALSWLGRLIGTPKAAPRAATGRERRTQARREVSIEARLVPEFGRAFACRIVDVSLGGARVRFESEAPSNVETVRLVFLPTRRTHLARVRWTDGTDLGLEFLD